MLLKSDSIIVERKGRAMPLATLSEMVAAAPKGTISSMSSYLYTAEVEFSKAASKTTAQAIFNKNFDNGTLVERNGRLLITDVKVY